MQLKDITYDNLPAVDLEKYLQNHRDLTPYQWIAGSLRADPSSIFDKLKNIPELSVFGRIIHDTTSKFKFGSTPRIDWKTRYKFSLNASDDTNPVNRNEQSIKNFVNQTVSFIEQKSQSINLVTGNIGSGKSTFNKYISTIYHDYFRSRRIVVSRFEFGKFRAYERTLSEQGICIDPVSLFKTYHLQTILRDIAHYEYFIENPDERGSPFIRADTSLILGSQTGDGKSVCGDDYRQMLYNELHATQNSRNSPFIGQTRLEASQIFNFIDDFIEFSLFEDNNQRAPWNLRWQKRLLGDDEPSKVHRLCVSLLIQTIERLGIRILSIIDGMDYMTAADYIDDSENVRKINPIFKYLEGRVRNSSTFELPDDSGVFRPFLQITLRHGTDQIFWRERVQTHDQITYHRWNVASPSIDHIVSVFEELYSNDVDEAGPIYHCVMKCVRQCPAILLDRLHVSRNRGTFSFTLDDLFQGNIRFFFGFIRDVLTFLIGDEEFLRKRIESGDYKGTDYKGPLYSGIAEQMESTLSRMTLGQNYVLVQLLLHSRSTRFRNFVSFSLDKDGRRITELGDNQVESGYVANIFNYHRNYRHDNSVVAFIVKIRIMHHLLSSNFSMNVDSLAADLGLSGGAVRMCLTFMIREGFVEPIYDSQHRSLCYRATVIARITYWHLLFEISYVEAVFYGSYFPRGLINVEVQDKVLAESNSYERVRASFLNCILTLRMLKTAAGVLEGLERGQLDAYFKDISLSIFSALHRVVNPFDVRQRVIADGELVSLYTREIDRY